MSAPQPISVQDALNVILKSVPEMGSESIPILDSLGRVLAEDVVATSDLPAFDNSAMDGYAIRSADVADAGSGSPKKLKIAGEAAAGSPFNKELEEVCAVRIMTGGLIPEGSDAVVELEVTREDGEFVFVQAPVMKGRNVRAAGGDAKEGAIVLEKGTALTPAHIGLLAALGLTRVGVSRRPTSALISTGSELVDATEIPGPGQIRNSSAYMIPAMLREAGAECESSVVVPDDEGKFEAAFKKGLECDLIITTGGVSVGKYDLVLRALEVLGVEIKFWRLNVKPGKPFAFGLAPNGTPVFCLPGNPVSTAVTFHKLVRPALGAMMGRLESTNAVCQATLEEDIVKKDSRVHYVRGILRTQNKRPTVRSTGAQGSNILTSMSKANCFIVLPEESRTYAAGEIVDVELL